MGMTNKMRIDRKSANTPPSLLGTDRRIVYANRKYHSGLMCGGYLVGRLGCSCPGRLVGRVKVVLVLLG